MVFSLFLFVEQNYALCRKRKISHSAKKKYVSVLGFNILNGNSSDQKHYFPVYRDNEIGINEFWQAHLIDSVRIYLIFRKLTRTLQLMMSN